MDLDVVVVGAGFAGVAMCHRLVESGFKVRVLEAASGVGGVWYWNRYPGARCDVESFDYSYSVDPELEQEWHWTEKFAPQPEILAYINHVVDRWQLRDLIDLDMAVVSATYSESEATWTVVTEGGRVIRSRFVVMATGTLSVTKAPDIPGVEDFAGSVFHTGHWPHQPVDLSGKRVGIIGVGSSGTQMVAPTSEVAEHLYVFQRTPNFCIPGPNAPMDPAYEADVKQHYRARREFTRSTASGLNSDMNRQSALAVSEEERRDHYEQAWREAGFGFILSYSDLLISDESNKTARDFIAGKIREIVKDPETANKLIPTTYPFGAKRPSVDAKYYSCFNRDNVTLVDIRSEPIESVTPTGIRTAAGEYDLDILVFATGYDAMTGAMSKIRVEGVGGRLLSEAWAAGPRTFLGLATEGFPNLFFLAGPGSPSVLTNVMVSIEQHVEWMGAFFDDLRDRGVVSVDVEVEAQDLWVERVNQLAAATLYPDANSWYLGADVPGKPRVFMPYAGGLRAYRRDCAAVRDAGYKGFVLRTADSLSSVSDDDGVNSIVDTVSS